MNAQDKQREQFDLWVRSRGGDVIKRGSYYVSSMTREWWRAWQAALQSHAAEAAQAQACLPSEDWFVAEVCEARNQWGERYEEKWLETDDVHPDDFIGKWIRNKLLAAAPQQAAEPVGHARTDGCMHFAYLPWSVKDGDPVYAAPAAEAAQIAHNDAIEAVYERENNPSCGSAQAQAQSGECQRNSPAGCDCIDTCVAISQPQAAEPVAWRCFDGNAGFQYYHGAPAAVGAGIELLYTHPQPPAQSGASKFVHSSPESRQAVLERVAERATQAQLEQSAQCAKDAARGIDARGHGAAPAGGP